MSKRRTLVRGGAQAITGLAVTAGAALLVTVLSGVDLPTVKRDIVSHTVSTEATSQSTIVCQGSFGALGLNASSPNDVTPIGEAAVTVSNGEAAKTELVQALPGGTAPTAYTAPGGATMRGAQTQRVDTETVRGMTASSCGEATNEQWLVGGSTARGTSSVIVLSNPGQVPATVTLGVYTETGPVEGVGTTGVLLQPGTTKTVALSGFGAGHPATAVRVQASGSPVFATMNVHQITDITPIGADSLNAQHAPANTLAFAGVKTFENHAHGEDAADGHAPATVRLLSPETDSSAVVYALTADGKRAELATTDLEAGVVLDLDLAKLPAEATAIVVEGEDPLLGGVKALVHNNNDHDFTWMTPSAIFDDGETVQATAVKGATLTLANLDDDEAEFTVGDKTVKLAAGTAKQIASDATVTVQGSAPFALGATLFDERSLSTYPVLGSATLIEEFTVYTR